ncbi:MULTISPECIES: UDP-3-O-(3-hydroxymyristoyl)glucosamine N-acyltransferase [Pedobacter]|uniref:UDP-3-O-acylglucosamine N-acyltransferase n=1 Tax=Pedobacter heparinus (strain ATCC 13125 / DSM 2366 / CIP 104194 / JCM 7457 / NBRC 12017 / NCIMB 9290 / NRRL B-14731 / HIM 762-3) TaxID=485917 RepID=C6XXG5_PEDHD|nr:MULTISPECIES: UDP-3-O-(3-hydroxymyristoyl)glucosamine N-acyltransferase [Pedobacter]ACU06471.1 UDP-3-O-(3-hydroxymyristoyl) glucosamine N-acyltransferase [Pedobacter heparinus DSM 2366]MBB5437158.1 UDP-3-O-[3-hydroxymyristoyl] glucosamine N-acyltransferase [Pedobacter sp. AK017]
MQFTAKQISEFIDGTIEGDERVGVSELSKIEDGKAGSLCFLSNPKYENYLYSTSASVVIVGKDFVPSQQVNSTLIRVADPYSAFSVLLEKYNEVVNQNSAQVGIEQPSFIHPSAKIGKNVFIGAFSYIAENVEIGDNCKVSPQVYIGADSALGRNCTLFPGVKLYNRSVLGNNIIIHSNTVVGSDGFGFAPQADGTYTKIAQIGNVVIEDDVEIGANTSIDRATMGSTFIRKGVKLDNLIQIAHNVDVGEHSVVAAQTGISGSSKLGEKSVIGGQVGIAGHLSLAKGTQIGAQAGINFNTTEENKQWHGSPAQPLRDWMRASVIFKQLPSVEKRIASLEAKIKQLNELIEQNSTIPK